MSLDAPTIERDAQRLLAQSGYRRQKDYHQPTSYPTPFRYYFPIEGLVCSQMPQFVGMRRAENGKTGASMGQQGYYRVEIEAALVSEFPPRRSFAFADQRVACESPSRFPGLWGATTQVVRGRDEVLSRRPLLERLADQYGQPSAASQLEYFLTLPWSLKKIPHLVLISLPPGRWNESTAQSGAIATAPIVHGAVLVFEYALKGIGTRIFATDDSSGVRTVFGPEEIRPQIAKLAAETLLRQHAQIVLISCRTNCAHPEDLAETTVLVPGSCSATQWRQVRDRLQLADTYDKTLAALGKHTRRNLRYYRRLAEKEIGVEFVPDAHGKVSESDFQNLNLNSTHPSTALEALRRLNSMRKLKDPVFFGLRRGNGEWLSLAGGWHCGSEVGSYERRWGNETWIEWQLNRVGLENLSISTVMRAYMLETLIARGTRTLAFIGGTPHTMSESFRPDWTADVILRRRSLTANLVRGYAGRIFRAENCLSQSLTDANLEWRASA